MTTLQSITSLDVCYNNAERVRKALKTSSSSSSSSSCYLARDFSVSSSFENRASCKELMICLVSLVHQSKHKEPYTLAQKIIISLQLMGEQVFPGAKKVLDIAKKTIVSLQSQPIEKQLGKLQRWISLLLLTKEHVIAIQEHMLLTLELLESKKNLVYKEKVAEKTKDGKILCVTELPKISSTEGWVFFCKWFSSFKKLTKRKDGTNVDAADYATMGFEQIKTFYSFCAHPNKEIKALAKMITMFAYDSFVAIKQNRAANIDSDCWKTIALGTGIRFDQKQAGLANKDSAWSFLKDYIDNYIPLIDHFAEEYEKTKNGGVDPDRTSKALKICEEFLADVGIIDFTYECFYTQFFALINKDNTKRTGYLSVYGKLLYGSLTYHTPRFVSAQQFTALQAKDVLKEIKILKETKAFAEKEEKEKKEEKQEEKKIKKSTGSLDHLFVKKDFPFEEWWLDERVTRWSNNPPTLSPTAIWKHNLPPVIDAFVGTNYSVRGSWDNPTTGKQDILYCMVAEIEDEDQITRGIIQICIDEDGICYHRNFGERSNQALMDDLLSEKVFAIEFPPLEESVAKKGKPVLHTIDTTTIAYDPVTEIVTIPYDKHTIKLFKLN